MRTKPDINKIRSASEANREHGYEVARAEHNAQRADVAKRIESHGHNANHAMWKWLAEHHKENADKLRVHADRLAASDKAAKKAATTQKVKEMETKAKAQLSADYAGSTNTKKVAAIKAKLEAHPGAKGPQKAAKGGKPKTHTKESAAKRLKTFAHTDTTHPQLQHMNVQNFGGQTSAVATDGHRIAIVPVHETTERGMHHASKKELARGVSAESLKEQGIKYPDINRVIPEEDKGKQHHLDAEALTHLAALGAAGPRHKVGGKMKQGGGNLVTFHLNDDGHAVAEAHHGAGGGKQGEIQGAHVSGRADRKRTKGGKRDRIGISAKYLHDALKGSKGKVRVQITDPYSPVVIHREDGEKHIIMPVRL